jgi:hypothetical protein
VEINEEKSRMVDLRKQGAPTDLKHEVLLPVGHEIEFKIKKNRMFVKALDGDRKARSYSIVAMKPANPAGESQSSSFNPSRP